MTAATAEAFPADEIGARARQDSPARALVTAVLAMLFGIGWGLGRLLLLIGWLGGRTWLILAYAAETIAYGFRQGAGLPVAAAPAEAPPNPRA